MPRSPSPAAKALAQAKGKGKKLPFACIEFARTGQCPRGKRCIYPHKTQAEYDRLWNEANGITQANSGNRSNSQGKGKGGKGKDSEGTKGAKGKDK